MALKTADLSSRNPHALLALLPTPERAALCLTNLAEEGFEPGAISVIAYTPAQARDLAATTGPLNALPLSDLAARLRSLGLPPTEAARYQAGVERGEILLILDAGGAEDAARETLEDHDAHDIRAL
ncbi:MAG TPA: hypothetical protein VKY56_09805 [Chloroflexota bacterium]|nr:hypothetical protein [Chloroflexota bacterium]